MIGPVGRTFERDMTDICSETGPAGTGFAGTESPPATTPWPVLFVLNDHFLVRTDIPAMANDKVCVLVTPRYVEIIEWARNGGAPAGDVSADGEGRSVTHHTLRLPEEAMPSYAVASLEQRTLRVRIPKMSSIFNL